MSGYSGKVISLDIDRQRDVVAEQGCQ